MCKKDNYVASKLIRNKKMKERRTKTIDMECKEHVRVCTQHAQHTQCTQHTAQRKRDRERVVQLNKGIASRAEHFTPCAGFLGIPKTISLEVLWI